MARERERDPPRIHRVTGDTVTGLAWPQLSLGRLQWVLAWAACTDLSAECWGQCLGWGRANSQEWRWSSPENNNCQDSLVLAKPGVSPSQDQTLRTLDMWWHGTYAKWALSGDHSWQIKDGDTDHEWRGRPRAAAAADHHHSGGARVPAVPGGLPPRLDGRGAGAPGQHRQPPDLPARQPGRGDRQVEIWASQTWQGRDHSGKMMCDTSSHKCAVCVNDPLMRYGRPVGAAGCCQSLVGPRLWRGPWPALVMESFN